MTVYTPNIPQPSDNPSDSQDQILENFQTLNTLYGTSGDHYPWNNTAPGISGRHAKVTLPGLPTAGSPPGTALPTPIANEGAIFAQTIGSQTTPFFTRDNLGPVAPLTNIWPLLPIKAFVTFTVVANAAPPQIQTINESYNITSVTRNPATTYSFVITNAMRTTNYGILFFSSSGSMNNQPGYNITLNTAFTITSAAVDGARVTVIVLEP